MNLELLLHRLSYLKWLFLLIQIALIAYCLVYQPPNLLSLIGMTLFATGIYLGLDGLTDIRKMNEAVAQRYADPKVAEFQCKTILASIAVVAVISLLFMSLYFVFPARKTFDQLFELGVDCWGLILGLICFLKSTREKAQFALQTQQLSTQSIPPDEA